MQNDLKKNALIGMSGLLALATAVSATAQSSTAGSNDKSGDLEEIVVTGIRQSLQRNLNIKREASGVVDAITSEDIGKFPDSNVAASLQRVPGVSIQRDGQRGEANGITVRGFANDFNETLFDGRHISTATGGRSVDFSTVGADFVGGLMVMKTPDVTLSSSSIGATVNVLYPKPFDHPGLRVAASASGSRQQRSGKTTPSFGALFSDTFADDKFGVLADVIYAKRDTVTNRVGVSGWQGDYLHPCQMSTNPSEVCTQDQLDNKDGLRNIVSWHQQQFVGEQSQAADKRIDGRIALQWHPSEKVMLTLDDNYSKQDITTDVYGFGVWFDFNAYRNTKIDSNGTIVDFINQKDVMNWNASVNGSLRKTNQIGFNADVGLSDNLSINFDTAFAKSTFNGTSDNMDTGYGGIPLGCNMGVRIVGDSSNTLPEMTTYGPGDGTLNDNNCNQSRVIDPSIIGSHVIVRTRQENSDTVKQGKFVLTWKQEGLKIDLGTSVVNDNFMLHGYNTFANNFWQTWAGYGPPSAQGSGVILPANLPRGTISTSDFIPGYSGNGALMPNLLVYSPFDVYSYLEGLGNPQATNIPGYNYPCCGTNYTGKLDLASDASSVQDLTERTWSLFFRANFETKLGELPFHLSAGLREERTDISSGGVGQLPVNLAKSSADPTLLVLTKSNPVPIVTDSNYSFLLPSLDTKLELTHNLHLRFDVSRTLTRAALNKLTPVLNVDNLPRVNNLPARGGNPALKPFLSDNIDLGMEWYYAQNDYVSGNFFYKDVTNFIVEGTQRQTINDVIDPYSGQKAVFTVTQQVNGPNARIWGWELAWQHMFGDSGFGFNANVTLPYTDKPYDKSDLTTSGFAITGLAKSANLVGFYDKHGVQVRVAVNRRDESLIQFGQEQNNSKFGTEPTFVNKSTQVDLSASYDFTPRFTVFFEGLNLTNDTISQHGRYSNQLLNVYDTGRRFTLGVRFKL